VCMFMPSLHRPPCAWHSSICAEGRQHAVSSNYLVSNPLSPRGTQQAVADSSHISPHSPLSVCNSLFRPVVQSDKQNSVEGRGATIKTRRGTLIRIIYKKQVGVSHPLI